MIGKLVESRLAWIIISSVAVSGVSVYLYLRGSEAAVAGVFAPLPIIMLALLATRENKIVTVEEENAGIDTTSLEENPANKTMSNTVKFLTLSSTNMYLRKTNEFRMDIYSSENQITRSSHYAPRRRPPCETPVYKKTNQTINSSKRPKL